MINVLIEISQPDQKTKAIFLWPEGILPDISNEELNRRKSKWIEPPLKVKRGSLYKYAKLVSSAAEGCVTDNF